MDNNGVNIIIDELYEMIQNARSVPLAGDKCILERDTLLDMLDDIIAELPSEIKQARKIVASCNELTNNALKESESVIAKAQSQAATTIASANSDAEKTRLNAKTEAESIIAKAKLQAQEMVKREAIYKETEKQCEEMIDKTNAKIEELRTVSNKYIADSLSKAAKTIEASLKDVNETRSKFEELTGEKKANRFGNKSNAMFDINID
jgi:cell division septum initiation protein DivIVA